MSSGKNVAAAVIVVTGVLFFVFRDQLFFFNHDEVTSDVEVDWSSCTVTDDLGGGPYKFLRCTEPTMVWMAVQEGPYGDVSRAQVSGLQKDALELSGEIIDEFKQSHQLSTDMTNTSEHITLGGTRMLWDEVYAQELRKKDKFTEEVRGHGMRLVRFGDGMFRVLLCVSHTDSDTLCENAGVDLLYNGLDETLGR